MEPLKKAQVEGFLMFAEPEVLFGNLDELCSVSPIMIHFSKIRIFCSKIRFFNCDKTLFFRDFFELFLLII